jgi:hypothetical protein
VTDLVRLQARDNSLVSVSRGVSLHVVRPRPRRAMRTHLGVQIALDRVPAAPVSALGAAVACAIAPADHDQIAYSAASTTSAESAASGARVRGPEASCDGAPAAIRNDVAAPKLKGFVSKTLWPRLGLKVTGTRCATADLNALTGAREEFSVGCGAPAGRKLSITATITSGFRVVSYQSRVRWGQHNSFVARED